MNENQKINSIAFNQIKEVNKRTEQQKKAEIEIKTLIDWI